MKGIMKGADGNLVKAKMRLIYIWGGAMGKEREKEELGSGTGVRKLKLDQQREEGKLWTNRRIKVL